MQGLVHIWTCSGQVIHLSIGAVTVRLDPEAFQQLAKDVVSYAATMREPEGKTQLQVLKGRLL